jgi:hypothetical protein
MKQLYIISILVFVFYSLLISNNIRKNNNEHFDYIDFDMVLDKKCESINSLNEHYDWNNRKMLFKPTCVEKQCQNEICFKMDVDTCTCDYVYTCCDSSQKCKDVPKHECCPNGIIDTSQKILEDGKCMSKICTNTQDSSDDNGIKNYTYIGCEDEKSTVSDIIAQHAKFQKLYLPKQESGLVLEDSGTGGQDNGEQNYDYKHIDSIISTPSAGAVYDCTVFENCANGSGSPKCDYDNNDKYGNNNKYKDIYSKECRKCPKNHYVLYAEGHQSKACCDLNKCFGSSTLCYDKDNCKKLYKSNVLDKETCECGIPEGCDTNAYDFNLKCGQLKKKPICDKTTEISCYVSEAQTFIKYKNNDECILEPVDVDHKKSYQPITSIFDCKRTCPVDTRYIRSTNKCTCKDRTKTLNNDECG